MTGVAAAIALLAVAVLVAPGPVAAARRLAAVVTTAGEPRPSARRPVRPVVLGVAAALAVAALVPSVAGIVAGLVVGVAAAVALPRWEARRAAGRPDPLGEAAAWDQLAACLRAGLPLASAARAVAPVLPAAAGAALTRVADLAALGADPVAAWEPALAEPVTARLARAARRSARSGAAVAEVAEAVATEVRAEAADAVATRAERAGVLVTGPLGLCFLPAFLTLGIAPVVIGLAGPLLEQR